MVLPIVRSRLPMWLQPAWGIRMWRVFRNAALKWIDDRNTASGAAIAFYTIFSLPPVILVVLAIAGAVFGSEEARAELFQQITGLVGDSGAKAIQQMLASASDPRSGFIALIVGPLTFILGATAVFVQLQTAFNDIWGVTTEKFSPWIFLRRRLVSFALILAMGFLLAVSLAVDAALVALGGYLFGAWDWVARLGVLQTALSLLVLSVMFALMFKILPDAVIAWRDVWFGGAVTAVLFTLGKFLIGFYFAEADIISSYGAPGTFIVVLLWVYYSSLIVLYGAEVTHQWQVHKEGAGAGAGAADFPPVTGSGGSQERVSK